MKLKLVYSPIIKLVENIYALNNKLQEVGFILLFALILLCATENTPRTIVPVIGTYYIHHARFYLSHISSKCELNIISYLSYPDWD